MVTSKSEVGGWFCAFVNDNGRIDGAIFIDGKNGVNACGDGEGVFEFLDVGIKCIITVMAVKVIDKLFSNVAFLHVTSFRLVFKV